MFLRKLGRELKGLYRIDTQGLSHYLINKGEYGYSIAKLNYQNRTLYLEKVFVEEVTAEKMQSKLIKVLKISMPDLKIEKAK